MTLPATIFILLAGAAAILAAVQSLRADSSRVQKTVFVLIRILIAALLLLAFIEPVLTVHRIPSRDRPLTALVDASSSMSLFAKDTTVGGFLDRLQAMGGERGRSVTVLFFGDSLREKKPGATYAATDRKSLFPSVNDHAALRSAAGVLIVSDGNWSNSGPVAEGFADKPVNFLALSQMRRPAWIAFDAPDTVLSTAGARCTVSIECSGYATTAAAVAIEAAADDKPVFSDTIRVEAGRFSRPVRLRLPARAAGMHLFRITLTNPRDTVSHQQYLLRRSVPSSITYTIAAGRPSLDERFLRLALAAVPAFRETTTRGNSREQVRFMLHAPAADMPPSPTLPVYIGCLPTAPARMDTVAGDGLFLPPDAIRNPLDGLSLQDVPPIAFVKPGRALTVVESWLSTRATVRDTVPLLYHALLRGRPLVACAFEGLWKWDFLPLSHRQGEADAQLFSRRLLAITQATLMAAAADTMIVWPAGRPSAFATLKLACITPRYETSIGAGRRIACSITGKNPVFRYDTVLAMAPGGQLLNYHTLPPLQPGDYSLRCSLSTPVRNYQSVVPFSVDADNNEFPANGQNTALLRELGQPIGMNDTARLSALFNHPEGAFSNQPVEERFPIKRSWWILGALFALFGAEWLLRRVANLD